MVFLAGLSMLSPECLERVPQGLTETLRVGKTSQCLLTLCWQADKLANEHVYNVRPWLLRRSPADVLVITVGDSQADGEDLDRRPLLAPLSFAKDDSAKSAKEKGP